ncbi:MAG TPA: sugar phosphate nucleotidyltransferase [Gemmatimonadaceae bacterium]|jgi:mannose-1-phosphate guanylyltransferase|nr:sugar phosphate nucleotidyltransferase [Gemmatimonadaceae bacterium]
MSRWAVVLAGGVGSRFWPLSTPSRPKQLLPLVNEKPLLVQAVERLGPVVPLERVLILTNAGLVPAIREMLPGIPRKNLIAEPRAGGTAAALTWAAQEIARRAGPDDVMISIHADWAIRDEPAFQRALTRAAEVAEEHHALVTVGVVPTRPDPGLGHIQPGEEIDGDARRVERFVEKPDLARAEQMTRDGYLWNSGIFAWRVGDYLDEVRRLTPEVAPALHAHAADIDGFFAAVKPIAVDVGVLERSDRVAVLPGDFGWDDVGTWAALRRVRTTDAAGNATQGRVHTVDSRDNVVHAPAHSVVLYGVSDLVVVVEDGMVLVTTVERSMNLKHLIEALPRGVTERE